MFAKRLFYTCAAIFLLAAAYSMGVNNAKAAPTTSNPIVAMAGVNGAMAAVTANGDVFFTAQDLSQVARGTWTSKGNVFTP